MTIQGSCDKVQLDKKMGLNKMFCLQRFNNGLEDIFSTTRPSNWAVLGVCNIIHESIINANLLSFTIFSG